MQTPLPKEEIELFKQLKDLKKLFNSLDRKSIHFLFLDGFSVQHFNDFFEEIYNQATKKTD